VAYLQRADFDAAITELRAAIETSPQDATLHYNLGLALKLKDLLADAVPELEKAAQLDPQQADIRYTLGVTLWQMGEFDKATQRNCRLRYSETRLRGGVLHPGDGLQATKQVDRSGECTSRCDSLAARFCGRTHNVGSCLRATG
jgi:tetratricopeptide (TPR) repeat protein